MPEANDMERLREFAQTGSETAFAELVRRHIGLVYSVALRHVGSTAHAEEITQAVFIILARRAARLRPGTVLAGWLHTTARLTALSFLRGERRRQFREQEAYMQSIPHDSNPAGPDADWQQLAPLLDEAIARLGQKDRDALLLRFFKNQSIREVAGVLGMNEPAAQRRILRALEKLRKNFAKRGVHSSVAAIAGCVSANSIQIAPTALAKAVTAVALVKGAAASASTLTLIQGALKIMAWTKVKIAVVAAAIVGLTVVGSASLWNHICHSPPAQSGRMKLPVGNVTPMVEYGYSRDVLILASDGSLWSFGEEYLGWPVLGLSDTSIKNTPVIRRIGHDSDWIDVSAGDAENLAIKSDGTLWAWGENLGYQLGDGTKVTRPTPVPSIPGNDWKQAAAGTTSYAIKNDGTLWAWGNNWAGQLGIGNTKDSTNAVQVGTSTNWAKIWSWNIQTVGLQTDGSLWFWGTASGDGNKKATVSSPRRVSPDTNWVDVCCGYFTMFAIKADGTLWAWGRDAHYYTGVSSADSLLTPAQIGSDTDWQSCHSGSGGYYQLLTKKDGSLWAMDASDHRIINPDGKYRPVQFKKIDWHKDIAAYTAGGDNIGVILTHDGEVWTWGRVLGELGPKDYFSSDGRPLYPQGRVIEKPWRLSNEDP